jgi:hypothetical protein
VFCEGVRHRLRFCLDHLSCFKIGAFQFYLQLGKQRRTVGWWTTIMLVPWWNGSLKRCVVVAEVRGKVFSHFHAVAMKHHSSDPGRILDVKEKRWACCWLLFICFQYRWSSILHVRLMLSSPNACLIIVRISVAISQDLRKIWCAFAVGSTAKSHHATYTAANKRT